MEPGLYIVGTPIGNLEDITYRAIATLKAVDLVLAEDTRHTRKLFSRYNIGAAMASCHKFSEASRVTGVLRDLSNGKSIALVSNAGMPGISDPGTRIVRACHEAGQPVFIIPGPTAAMSTLALSGMGENGFLFAGFLSHKGAARRRQLGKWKELDLPIVVYESPHRILKLFDEIGEALGDCRLFVGRELTKRFEESWTGTPSEAGEHFGKRTPKGEFTVVIDVADRQRSRSACAKPDDG